MFFLPFITVSLFFAVTASSGNSKMSSEIKSCYIYSEDKSLPAIHLPDQTPVVVGRNPDTKIIDLKCSRSQVRLCANYTSGVVTVQQLGHRASGLNGYKTEHGIKVTARHGDRLEIIYGNYPYNVEFNPPPVCPAITKAKKRSLSDPDSDGDPEVCSVKKVKNGCALEEPSSTAANRDSDEESIKKEQPDKEMDTNEKETWEETSTLMIFASSGLRAREKIAAYDMDNTIIKTFSGNTFPKDHNDWRILYPEIPGKLKKLHEDGYKIVVLTNQGGMHLGKVKPADFKTKIEKIVKRLGVPMQVFIAAGKDIYRKPRIGMWEKLVDDKNDGVPVDKSKSFFVGDAAGRPKDWVIGKKKDHSSADRLLALNLGLTFYTPEEHFLGWKPALHDLPKFDPKALKNNTLCEPSNAELKPTKQEVIVMVGGPGSGKTHFALTYLKDYRYVNRDKLGSWQKCVTSMETALSEGKSVVIDNTNPDVVSRKRFLAVAEARGVPVRCFVMTTDKEHARHNNVFRELTDPSHMIVTDIIINSYSSTNSTLLWRCARFVKLLVFMCFRLFAATHYTNVQLYRKNYIAPTKDEGFAEIVRVNFVPRFDNDHHRRLYEMYLLEK